MQHVCAMRQHCERNPPSVIESTADTDDVPSISTLLVSTSTSQTGSVKTCLQDLLLQRSESLNYISCVRSDNFELGSRCTKRLISQII